jgi:hypothetical protein
MRPAVDAFRKQVNHGLWDGLVRPTGRLVTKDQLVCSDGVPEMGLKPALAGPHSPFANHLQGHFLASRVNHADDCE